MTKSYNRGAILCAAWSQAKWIANLVGKPVHQFIAAMRKAWALAKGADAPAAVEMVPQPVQQQQACAAEAPAAEPATVELHLGRGLVTRIGDRIRFYGQVTGGGANGPGNVEVSLGYAKSNRVRFAEDHRSGSKRSGSVEWHLQADRLYALSNVALNSSRSSGFYVSTFKGTLTELDRDEFEVERRRVWPLQAEEHDAAAERRRQDELVRMEREQAQAEERRIAREALTEKNAEEAERLRKEGQPRVAGLPKLTGTAKQVAYAISIRNAVMARQPDLPALRTERASKFWIETHRGALYR
ncbi:hypothetical protein IPV08_10615 [Methylobacterium sp. SD274]|uniref:Uncharacterized protein n=1 Tax=Methylobacterium gossipiicola TaxID=582675 RepID=A0A1I2UYD1_9HYPH|nr:MULTISPECIES: hypothetical protein [Methylobacterium]MBO1020420.1 hypothetical protein [Methylobacterium sp. SD274]SFG81179.1 hypothetical protein SAMN05192565_11230 [Methylobacterium gossipiicola]